MILPPHTLTGFLCHGITGGLDVTHNQVRKGANHKQLTFEISPPCPSSLAMHFFVSAL